MNIKTNKIEYQFTKMSTQVINDSVVNALENEFYNVSSNNGLNISAVKNLTTESEDFFSFLKPSKPSIKIILSVQITETGNVAIETTYNSDEATIENDLKNIAENLPFLMGEIKGIAKYNKEIDEFGTVDGVKI